MKQYRDSMSLWDFACHERQFADSFMTHCYHQWAYTDDFWDEWLETFSMGGEL